MAKEILNAPVLFDAQGRPIYPGGITRDDIRDAIQAAALVDDFATAQDIADRYGLDEICLNCGEKQASETYLKWRICKECGTERLERLNFSDTKIFTYGLIHRNVV